MIAQIDIDGTIDRAPDFFRWLTATLKRDGHKVLIVTSRTHSAENHMLTAQELSALGMVYHQLLLSPDYTDLPPQRIPADLNPGHRAYLFKVLAAEDAGSELVFDDCGITTELFRRYLPEVKVFRLLPRLGPG